MGVIYHHTALIDPGFGSCLPQFGTEVLTRTAPNLLDLGIALVAGGLATYAKLRSDAVIEAGTAIAVALVPPICVMGLHAITSASSGDIGYSGAAMLFTETCWGSSREAWC